MINVGIVISMHGGQEAGSIALEHEHEGECTLGSTTFSIPVHVGANFF